MELMVRDGDYVPDGEGGFLRAEGSRELLQRVLWKLTIRRGSFPPLPELGGRLHELFREPPSRRGALAQQYAAEALAGEAGLELTGAELSGDGRLRVDLLWRGEALSAAVEVRGPFS